MRIAFVEGGRAGMLGGTERVREKAEVRVGRRGRRRWERSIVDCCEEGCRWGGRGGCWVCRYALLGRYEGR